MVKRIMSDNFYQKLVKKIIDKNEYKITFEQFYELMNKKLGKIKDYIGLNKMKQIFQGINSRTIMGFTSQQLKEFYSIYRILCRNYLKVDHLTFVYNGLRIKKKSKKFHVVASRLIS
jgi:Ca2+-binding EF-hand superfamily protein